MFTFISLNSGTNITEKAVKKTRKTKKPNHHFISKNKQTWFCHG